MHPGSGVWSGVGSSGCLAPGSSGGGGSEERARRQGQSNRKRVSTENPCQPRWGKTSHLEAVREGSPPQGLASLPPSPQPSRSVHGPLASIPGGIM